MLDAGCGTGPRDHGCCSSGCRTGAWSPWTRRRRWSRRRARRSPASRATVLVQDLRGARAGRAGRRGLLERGLPLDPRPRRAVRAPARGAEARRPAGRAVRGRGQHRALPRSLDERRRASPFAAHFAGWTGPWNFAGSRGHRGAARARRLRRTSRCWLQAEPVDAARAARRTSRPSAWARTSSGCPRSSRAVPRRGAARAGRPARARLRAPEHRGATRSAP